MEVSFRRTMLLLSSLVLAAAACAAPHDRPEDEAGAREAGAPQAAGDRATRQAVPERAGASAADATRENADLVIWADEPRSAALRPFAESLGEDERVTVAVQEVPFEQIRDQFQVAGPSGDGPDVIIGAHEWLGELVPAGMVAPVDLGDREADLTEAAISAVTYDGRAYGVPYALSSVALVRNTRYVPTAPGSWEELEETARTLQQRGTGPVGLTLPADPYHLYPLVTALGGYLFGHDAAGGYDTSDLGIDSPGGLDAADRLREWVDEGVVELVGSGAEARDRFRAGDAAFAIVDPAALASGGHEPADSGVPYGISPVPPIDGGTARPFVGVEALMVSAFAADSELARRFVLDYAATGDGHAALATATGRPPAHLEAAEGAGDPYIKALAASARNGVPLPATPETGSVWGPWAEALERVSAEGADPRSALSGAADEIRELLRR